jgi:hypothetical protein
VVAVESTGVLFRAGETTGTTADLPGFVAGIFGRLGVTCVVTSDSVNARTVTSPAVRTNNRCSGTTTYGRIPEQPAAVHLAGTAAFALGSVLAADGFVPAALLEVTDHFSPFGATPGVVWLLVQAADPAATLTNPDPFPPEVAVIAPALAPASATTRTAAVAIFSRRSRRRCDRATIERSVASEAGAPG